VHGSWPDDLSTWRHSFSPGLFASAYLHVVRQFGISFATHPIDQTFSDTRTSLYLTWPAASRDPVNSKRTGSTRTPAFTTHHAAVNNASTVPDSATPRSFFVSFGFNASSTARGGLLLVSPRRRANHQLPRWTAAASALRDGLYFLPAVVSYADQTVCLRGQIRRTSCRSNRRSVTLF